MTEVKQNFDLQPTEAVRELDADELLLVAGGVAIAIAVAGAAKGLGQ